MLQRRLYCSDRKQLAMAFGYIAGPGTGPPKLLGSNGMITQALSHFDHVGSTPCGKFKGEASLPGPAPWKQTSSCFHG